MRPRMQTIVSWLSLLVASLSLVSQSARAEDIAIFPVESPNLAAADAIALGELLTQHYAAVSGAAVIAPAAASRALTGGESYADAARALGVREFVLTRALSVGRQIAVTATRYDASGALLYRAELTAKYAEELIPVSALLARALYTRVDPTLVRAHPGAAHDPRARKSSWREALYGVKTGIHVPFARAARFWPAVSVAFNLRLELERYFLEFGAGALIPTRADDWANDPYVDGEPLQRGGRTATGGLTAEVGASRILTAGDVALYAGGGAQPKLLLTGNEDIASIALYGQLGITLPRASSTRFSAELRFAQSLLPQGLDDDRSVFVSDASLHAGVGW